MGFIRVVPYQNTNISSSAYGKWYMRAFYDLTYDVTELAKHISQDSKVEREKVAAITRAVIKQMSEFLLNGHPIRVPHLGILKLGVSSKGAATVQEYNARTDIKDLYVMLVPDQEIKKALREMKFVKYIPDQKEPIDTSANG